MMTHPVPKAVNPTNVMREITLMKRAVTVFAAVLLLAAMAPAAALAHEGREVGEYNLVVGFRVEPALIDEPNGVYLLVTKAAEQGAVMKDDEAGRMSMDVEEHDAIFSSTVLAPGDEFSFAVESMLEGMEVPYHSHLDAEATGSVKVSDRAELSGRVDIEIHAGAFHPRDIEVKPGTVLVWTNKDSKDQSVNSGLHAGPGHPHGDEPEPVPVEGLADTLTVQVSYGSERRELSLSPLLGEPGAYVAHFVPTAAGTYVFRFRGTIEGMPVDEIFESGPGRFNDVEEKGGLAFPEPRLSPAELQIQVEEAAQSSNRAVVIGLIGIALGAIGTASGLSAIYRRRS